MLLRRILLMVLPICMISAGAVLARSGSPTRYCETAALEAPQASQQGNILLAQMSCRECSVRRDRCHTGCNSLSSSREQLQCVNRCNSNYPCVKGSDCR